MSSCDDVAQLALIPPLVPSAGLASNLAAEDCRFRVLGIPLVRCCGPLLPGHPQPVPPLVFISPRLCNLGLDLRFCPLVLLHPNDVYPASLLSWAWNDALHPKASFVIRALQSFKEPRRSQTLSTLCASTRFVPFG
jgi:hypothetical protein